MAKKYIIANWKMNPQSVAEAEDILGYIDNHIEPLKQRPSLVICPPFVFIEDVGRMLKTSHMSDYAELGSQDIALADSGAWTGEVSGPMLKRLGVAYVIVGHSERRWKLDENDEVVHKKLRTALNNDLTPIVCIGERERDAQFKEFIRRQIEATFGDLTPDEKGKCLIAYEPVWAISSNPNARPDNPQDTLEAVAVIKEVLGPDASVLYGGSVNAGNAKDFLALDELAGVLVGSASVKKEEFVEILKASV